MTEVISVSARWKKNHLHRASAEYSVPIRNSTFPAGSRTNASACRRCTRSFYVIVKALDNIASTRLFKILGLQSVDAFFERCLAYNSARVPTRICCTGRGTRF